jgi:hypothetical protein
MMQKVTLKGEIKQKKSFLSDKSFAIDINLKLILDLLDAKHS